MALLWNDIMHALRRQQVDIVIECGPQKTLTNLVKTVSGFSAYSYSKDREEIKHIIRERYSVSNNLRNLIERGLTIIACTRNCNDSMENYQIEECYGIYKQYREREMEEKDWEAVVEETRVLAEKWKSNKWCVRVLIELMGLLEHDDKERRRIAKEVEKEMEEAMQNDKAA